MTATVVTMRSNQKKESAYTIAICGGRCQWYGSQLRQQMDTFCDCFLEIKTPGAWSAKNKKMVCCCSLSVFFLFFILDLLLVGFSCSWFLILFFLFFLPFPRCVVFQWLIVVSCGTGWASTSSCNIRPPFHRNLSTTEFLRWHSQYAQCLLSPSSFYWQSVLVASYSNISILKILQYLSTFGTIGAFPFGRSTCVLSALPLGLDLTVRGTGHLHPPLHSPGDCNVDGVVLFSFLTLLLYLELNIQCFCDIFTQFVADRRATARTTVTLSHAATSQKKTSSCSSSCS